MLDVRGAVLALSLAVLAAPCSAAAAPLPVAPQAAPALLLVQSPPPPPQKTCRREPIWGFRVSPLCKPSGICNDRVIKGYRTVCT